MSDPFAPAPGAAAPGRKSMDIPPSARYPTPPFSPPPAMLPGSAGQHSLPSTASTRASVSSPRPQSTHGAAYQTMMDEFGQYLPQPNASGSGSRYRASHAPTMPLPSPEPSSMQHHHYQQHHASAMQEPTAQQRKRQSHNPAAVIQGSPPKQEYLSDEYVLHPSVHAYKQAHPNRAMIALGHYILLQTLGEGEFGKVKLGVHSEYGVEVAIKLIRRGTLDNETRANKVEREIEVLKQIKHPNIVRMLDVIDTAKYIGIVLEFAGGGELFDYILANRFLKEKDASRLFAQLISGVDYLHKKHIVHRDLKLENLLLDRHRNIIITDFGFANRFERDQSDLMATSCGSPCYAAPELVVSEGLYVGTAVDVWSCGVILYAMLSGYLPYDDDPDNPDGDNINLLYKYIMSTPLNFPDHMSRMAMDLLLMMLVPNPQDRCTIADIEIHPWLDNYRAIFERSVEDHERLFTENMNRKNQQARRDLAQRRRLQQEAKLAKALQRSQSTQSTSIAMLDHNRRTGKDHRHRSALPTTSTMPDYLYNAGHSERLPVLDTQPEYVPLESKSAHPSLPMPELPPLPSMLLERSPPTTSTTLVTPETPKRSKSTRERDQPDQEMAEPVTPPKRERDHPKTPHSANKNRHTIQVEYEGDMRWEEGAIETKPQDIVDPPQEPLSVPQLGDMEVDTASELESKSDVRTLTPPPETPSLADAAPILESPIVPQEYEPAPEEPTEDVEPVADDKPAEEPAPAVEESVSEAVAPPPRPPRRPTSIPQTPSKRAREDAPTTPKAPALSESQLATPKAEQRNAALPPGAATPKQQPSSSVPQADELPAPPRPQKRDRATRRTMGMSLDKLGLAKLLGQTQPPLANSRQSYIPVSQHNKSHSVAVTSSSPVPSGTSSSPDKKSRRKTLNLMSNGRAGTPDTSVSSRAPSAASTASKAPVVGPVGIQPRPSHDQSSPSLTTVDAFQGSDGHGHRSTASSSAAKRVMDWFRRKSAAKETLTTLKSSSVRGDSLSSAGRASMTVDRPDRGYVHITKPRDSTDVAQTLVRDESIGGSTTGPSIVVSESPASKPVAIDSAPARRETTTRRSIDVVRSIADRVERRQPLAPANSKANIDDKKNHLGPERAAVPVRSKSVRTPDGMHHSLAAGSGLVNPQSVAGARTRTANAATTPTPDENKMRVHTGLVDQSALSSREPAEVIAEVISVLHGMGIDVKQEADFRLRCTRVRRRKAGPTTGLSTGTSPGSVALKNGDARGLPSTGSGGLSGLKGMLLRRGSSYSSYSSAALARSESDLLASASNSTTPVVASPQLGPVQEPLYGEHSIDNGDEVKFVVELCRIKNLQGLYLLNIKRLRGSVWSFKFIYQTIVERTQSLTH